MTISGFAGCTIVARNYLAYAHVLAEGWTLHNHGTPMHVLVIDEDGGGGERDGLQVLTPDRLGIAAPELARMRGIYGVAELTTALKPHLLRHLLDTGAEAAVFVDSDTEIHGDLGGAAELASRHGIVLSPHFLVPPPLDGRSPSELEKLRSGIFNSGFLAVGPSGRPFLDWWSQRLRRDCLFSDPIGLHADQGWLPLVPSYFDHVVLRDPGVNVAPWNVHERPIRYVDGVVMAGEVPLRMFHYAGFDPEHSRRPGPYEWPFRRFHEAIGSPAPLRTDISAEPGLERLCRSYCDKLYAADHLRHQATPYGYARTAAGRPLQALDRRAYRELLLAAEALGRTELVPDPFDAARSAEFERMIDAPHDAGLLSSAACARLTDTRLAGHVPPGRWHLARVAATLARQVPRRAPGRRHAWMPHPLPSDRTRYEYSAGESLEAVA